MTMMPQNSRGETLAQARAKHARDEVVQRGRATLAVTHHSTDPTDQAMLLAMLGLDPASLAETPIVRHPPAL
jgi:hypothetical protein